MADKKEPSVPIQKGAIAQDSSHIKVPSKPLSVSGGSVIKTPPKPTSTGSKEK
jgi:hypothetical protein